jgi:hypothetical protein
MNIMPVAQIDDTILRKDAGEKTKELQKIFKEFCESH